MVEKVISQAGLGDVLAHSASYASIHSRIRERREAAGLSMHALAELVGVKAWQTIQQWEREPGGTAPRRERLSAVAEALKTTPEYLLFGHSQNAGRSGPNPSSSTEPVTAPRAGASSVRLDASKARPVFVVDTSRSSEGEGLHVGHPGSSVRYAEISTDDPGAFLLTVADSTMYPRYKLGEHVLVEPGEKCDVGDDVFVQLRDGTQLIRELVSRQEGFVELAAHNCPEQASIRISSSDIQFMYYVSHTVPARRIKQVR